MNDQTTQKYAIRFAGRYYEVYEVATGKVLHLEHTSLDDIANDPYWNDDPNDPMPSHWFFNESIIAPYDPVTGRIDKEAAARAHEKLLDKWFRVRQSWWKRRIARERLREHPHPDTDVIAHNAEIKLVLNVGGDKT